MHSPKITLSLVVTVKNAAIALRELLRGIDQQTLAPDEVVLVVAESGGQTLAVAQEWKPEKTRAVVLSKPLVNRSVGRNLGVEHAHGEVVVFTDAGCRPEPDWLENLTRPFQSGAQLVGGYTVGEGKTLWEKVQIPFVLVPLNKIPPHPLPATRNMALKRSIFRKFGGFRPELNYAEDFEFSRRLAKEGIKTVFVPEAKIYWRPRPSVLSFAGMIAHLTAGDVQAGILRPGLLSMWGRYLLFVVLGCFSPVLGGAVYVLYLVFKLSRLCYARRATYLLAVPLQVVCDGAVLSGSLSGLASRLFPRENTNNVS